MPNHPSFGQHVRLHRKARDLTQSAFADLVGCARITITNLERDRLRPSKALAARLAEKLGLDPAERAVFLQAARADVASRPRPVVSPDHAAVEDTPHAAPPPPSTVTLLLIAIADGLTPAGEPTSAVRRRGTQLLRAAIEQHGGLIFNSDEWLLAAAFPTAAAAVATALHGQRELQATGWNTRGMPTVRMALHSGAADQRTTSYAGDTLDRAERILAVGQAGLVLLSAATRELVRDDLPPDAELNDLGTHRLLGLSRPEHLYHLTVPGISAESSILHPRDHRPTTNVRVPVTPLIGREHEMRTITAVVQHADVRLITLTGPGGTGKTRLAVELVTAMHDTFVDGVWFVDLAPITEPALVPAVIAQVLGVRESGSQSLLDQVHRYLRARQLLLVLDNFEQVAEAAPVIAALLATARDLKVLVTSRAALHLTGEHEIAVAPLALPDGQPRSVDHVTQSAAVRLFIARAQAVNADFVVTDQTAPAVAAICARLDGLPLAIELAAARVKLFAPRALLQRLDQRLQFLTGGARDLPARQQTIRATIDWSYHLLTPPEQRLFARLGIFNGGWTLDAAEAVVNVDGDLGLDVVDGLASLVDQNLIRAYQAVDGDIRFTMLETLREYALERLDQQGDAARIRRTHRDWYLLLAQQAAPELHGANQLAWFDTLQTEHDNLYAALAWSQAAADGAADSLHLTAALGWFWFVRGSWREGRAWLTQALARPAGAEGVQSAAAALTMAGHLSYFLGDYPPAQRMLDESVRRFRALGDPQGLAFALQCRANMYGNLGADEQCRTLLQESIAEFQRAGDGSGMALSLAFLGNLTLHQGDVTAAQAVLHESLAIARGIGDTYTMALALRMLGGLALVQADFATAQHACAESIALSRALGNASEVALAQLHFAEAIWHEGAYDQADRTYAESLVMAQDLGDKELKAMIMTSRGDMASSQHDHPGAQSWYEQSLAINRELDNGGRIASLLRKLGNTHLQQGDVPHAKRCFRESLGLHQQRRNRRGIADVLASVSDLAASVGQAVLATRMLAASTTLQKTGGFTFEPGQHIDDDRGRAAIRSNLDQAMFAAAWQAGQALSVDEAIAEALRDLYGTDA